MTKFELEELFDELTAKAKEIMERKNVDYAYGSDPFANFKGSVFLGIEPEIGAMMRMMDKFKRIESFIKAGKLEVLDESVEDTIIDLINYPILIAGMIRDRKNGKATDTNND